MEDIEFPTDDGIFKAIQLYIDKKPVLRLGKEHHAVILEDTLREYGINNFETRPGQELIPAKEGERYKLIGASACMKIGQEIIFSGKSEHYGLGVDEVHLSCCSGKEGIELIIK